jgi:hypothetical protein
MSSKITAEQQQLMDQLVHVDPEVILDTIKAISEVGNVAFISPLIGCYLRNNELEIKTAVLNIFADLHDTKAMDAYILQICALDDDKFDGPLLSAVWQGKFSVSEYLGLVVNKALGHSFEAMFELNTILENTIETYSEETQLECLLALKKYMSENPDSELSAMSQECEKHLKALTIEE